jgi:transcriptional regulator with XRE-family HTH domain
MSLKSKIKEYRLSKGIMQKWLSEQIKASPEHVRLWEKGQSFPSALYLLRMCKALDCKIEDLLEEIEEGKE